MSQAIPTSKIPVLDLSPEIDALWPELEAAVTRVMRSAHFIMGEDVTAFEREVAAFLGVRHAVGVNSGTDALVIALRALGIGPGDEVITTPFSFFATAESISAVGATPVFADIEEASFNIDPDAVERAITPRTRAILPVHLFGHPAAMDRILEIARRHDLRVVEDCAQAFGGRIAGRRTGALGDIGAYSFFPSKNLGAFGDGGLIATDDDRLADQARMLRAHGGKHKYHNEMIGYNSRLDSLQAAVLRVKLPHVDAWNDLRREAAARYDALLAPVAGVKAPERVDGHVYHQYTVRLLAGGRDAVRQSMQDGGVSTMVYYPTPQDRLPAYEGRFPRSPRSELAAGQVLSLPIWPTIAADTQERVVAAMRDALR